MAKALADRVFGGGQLIWRRVVIAAWNYSPSLAVRLLDRFKQDVVKNEVEFLVKRHPEKARTVAEALPIFLGEKLNPSMRPQFRVRRAPSSSGRKG